VDESITRVTRPTRLEIEKFISTAGSSLNTFRYFKKRDSNFIERHVVTTLYKKGDAFLSYGHLDREGNDVWLGVCVAEDYLGRGYGRQMMLDLLAEGEAHGIESIRLTVDADNSVAVKLYEKLGFCIEKEERNTLYMRVVLHKRMHGYYSNEEIENVLGIKNFGENVFISKKVSIYGGEKIRIGSNVRIDDYCVIAAGGDLDLEGYNHIAPFCYINSKGRVTLRMFSGLSSRCSIYSASDDYTGEHLTNPTVPKKYLKLSENPVTIGRHVVIGTGSSVLPGVTIGDFSAIGAHSLVNKNIPEGKIAAGVPAKVKRDRSLKMLELEKELLEKENG